MERTGNSDLPDGPFKGLRASGLGGVVDCNSKRKEQEHFIALHCFTLIHPHEFISNGLGKVRLSHLE